MPELWLVRHGEFVGNVENLVTGHASDPLTDRGRDQARALGEWMSANYCCEFELAICSTMTRAIETAELLRISDNFEKNSNLNETDAGDVSSLKREVFDRTHKDFWKPFDPYRPFPGGESHMDLYTRVVKSTIEMLNSLDEHSKILMVAHAGTISSIFHNAYNVPMEYFSRFKVSNASLTILNYDEICESPELICFNATPGDLPFSKKVV